MREAGVDITLAGALERDTTPLITAVEFSLLAAAEVLRSSGANVNERSADGQIWPLSVAAHAESNEGMTWLLWHGASLTRTDEDGRTIAHTFAMPGRPLSAHSPTMSPSVSSRALRRVIAATQGLRDARDVAGRTPLMLAALTRSEAAIATLLELGANVGVTSLGADTALSLACITRALPVVRLLLAVRAANASNLTPESPQARRVASSAVAAALAPGWSDCRCAVRCKDAGVRGRARADGLDILRAVLADGVRESVSSYGNSLGYTVVLGLRRRVLCKRIAAGHTVAVLQVLRAGGVDVLAGAPADESSVLRLAVGVSEPALIRWLVSAAGAALEVTDESGFTPLMAACARGAWATAHVLLDLGARADTQSAGDARGWWPVALAVRGVGCDAM
jgi:ankyrin repeat protein